MISVSFLICEKISDKDLLITASSSCGMNIIMLMSLLTMTTIIYGYFRYARDTGGCYWLEFVVNTSYFY